jgi:hypothetical protein
MAIIRSSQLDLSSITGSLLGTASYAVYAETASYALNITPPFPFSGSAVVTGSIYIVSQNPNTSNLFLIKNSAEVEVFNVSQSGIINLSTQSVELSGSAPNGGMYFTSNSFFVGLD